jgi:hypothetical protein
MRIESTRYALVAALAALATGLLVGCVAQAGEADGEHDPSVVADEGATPEPVTRVSVEGTGSVTKSTTAVASTPGSPTNPNPNEPQPFPWVPNGPASNMSTQTASAGTQPATTTQPTGAQPGAGQRWGAGTVQAGSAAAP